MTKLPTSINLSVNFSTLTIKWTNSWSTKMYLEKFRQEIVTRVFSFYIHTNFLFKSIKPFPNKPLFLRVCSTSLLKTLWEKEKLLITSNFSFSHSIFFPFGELSAVFIKLEIVVCKLFEFGRV